MLATLHIQNYALIDNLELDFGPGLNVLTGETGAGKSIIVDALNLVLGARASSDAVRDGAEKAKVSAVFRIGKLPRRVKALFEDLEVEPDGEELVLARTVMVGGHSRAHVGGSLASVSVLARIGEELVDLHGQHEHQSLLKAERQLELLDAFGGLEAETESVASLVTDLRAVEKSLSELETDDRERARRVEFLRFGIAEIDNANLQVGEEEEVRSRRNLITNAERVAQLAASAYAALYEGREQTAIDALDTALAAVDELARIDDRFGELSSQLSGLRAALADAAMQVRAFAEGVEYDPAELEALNQRISLIGSLKRKYGDSIEAILAYRDHARSEVELYEQRDQRLAALQVRREQLLKAAEAAAALLSERRRGAASKLDKRVSAGLQDLGMKGAQFETRIDRAPLGRTGIDRIEFLLAANPGEKAKPLRLVASGGEISRVMLGIKTVFAAADRIPTLIFDEIDAGVGGAVAGRVAARLRELSGSHQTICITHLPQIAAAADVHYHVGKVTAKGRTKTMVTRIEDRMRVEEVARMLDGSVSAVSLEHAASLLAARGAAAGK